MTDKIVKNLNFGNNAKEKVFTGIEKLTKAVSSTLGASGKCVILEDNAGRPVITKDGVTVANAITLLDPVENIGATLIKQAAQRTVSEAGDGTTTATVLAHAILKQAYKALKSHGTRDIKDGINAGVKKVCGALEKLAIPVTGDMVNQVATISANNDKKLGDLIAEAFKAVDNTGVVMMETSNEATTTIEIVDGVQYDKGLKNFHFVTNKENGTSELNNPLVLIVESEVPNIRKIQSVLEYVIKNKRSLLIVADLGLEVLNALAMNHVKGNIKVNVVDAPTYGVTKKEVLQDLALLTGATVINENLGDDMDLIQPEHLGECLKSVTNNEETIFQINEPSKEAQELLQQVKKQLDENAQSGFRFRLEKRIARLSAKVASVKVGANSEVELKEKKDRVEDAICATKAAIKEGIVPGGGIALLNASTAITAKSEGEKVLLEAIRAPYETILSNAGLDIVYPQTKNKGLNVVTGKDVNMVRAGIIDPLLVTKSALKNAASVATTIISTDCVINNLRVTDESNR